MLHGLAGRCLKCKSGAVVELLVFEAWSGQTLLPLLTKAQLPDLRIDPRSSACGRRDPLVVILSLWVK
jgi:hypothetical protein